MSSSNSLWAAATVATCMAGVGVGVGWLARQGVFSKVEWKEEEIEGFEVAFVEHTGPYSKIHAAFDALMNALESKGIKVSVDVDRLVGIFYDNPAETPEDKCRSRAGIILPSEQLSLCGLRTMQVPKQAGLLTRFPYYNDWSLLLGVYKVYPALKEACKRAGGRSYDDIVEIYDKPNHTVTYFAGKVPDKP